MPIGFNEGRIFYFNNLLWYVLLAVIIILLSDINWIRICSITMMCMQLILIIVQTGEYQETFINLTHSKSIQNGCITYQEFYDTRYFDKLKKIINYQGENIINFGYDPAVTMYNGFNTLDGYLCVNPLSYHYRFRRVIEPLLENNPEIAEYYDNWGGRIYVFENDKTAFPATRKKVNLEKELLINSEELKKMGGVYILSRYKISNSRDLHISLVTDLEEAKSIYHVWVYKVN